MSVIEKFLKGLNFKLFILSVLSNVMVMAQTATVPLTNNFATVYNTNENKMFHGQESTAGGSGYQDNTTDERVVVTYEALNLTIT